MKQIAISVFLLLLSFKSFAAEVRIVDGDTLKIGDVTHRLYGIDAPEEGQKCKDSSSKDWPCGKLATDRLQELASGTSITCNVKGKDGYGRMLSVCSAGSVQLNAYMVRNGFAWAFEKYAQDYLPEQELAKAEKLGVWVAPTQTAWDYRAARWNDASQRAPEGCPIKGNISKNGRIYHAPWSPWYSRTKINVSKGERWFCDEAEAVAAGWRAPMWR